VRVALSIDDVEDACRAYVGIVWSLLDEFRLDEAEPFVIEALALAEQPSSSASCLSTGVPGPT
jgi:hypothetical protein